MGSGTPYYIIKTRYRAIFVYQEVYNELRSRFNPLTVQSTEESKSY